MIPNQLRWMRGLTTRKVGAEDLGNAEDQDGEDPGAEDQDGENLEEDGIKSKYNIYEKKSQKKSQKKAQKIKKKTPKNKKAQKTAKKNASPP